MRLSNRSVLALAALNGLLAVACGAFAAHGMTDPQAKEWLRTGATYQLAHAAAAFAVQPRSRTAALLMGLGGLVFALSLDVLAADGPRWTGAVTPLGGVLMIAGWICAGLAALRTANPLDL
jgi:uncharacterized membrane protein YgdD (TMEM256/DUF423 family)